MRKLKRSAFREAENFLDEFARDLEKYRFRHSFKEDDGRNIAEELKDYQNKDGGFGNALEPDFRSPASSPMATSVGLRYLREIDQIDIAKEMIRSAVSYLESSFDEERNGWYSVPPEVNEYPHAWWWHWDEEEKMTIIDKHWGNPTAEIIAYLKRYREYTKDLDVDLLADHAVEYIEDKEDFGSENELYCYLHLYKECSGEKRSILEDRISEGIGQVLVSNEENWGEYVPKPLDFVKDPGDNRFGINENKIQDNLKFLVNQLEENKVLEPDWDTSVYEGDFKQAIDEWKGILTLKALSILDNYGLIER